jgi:type VI protein secretion system component VasK
MESCNDENLHEKNTWPISTTTAVKQQQISQNTASIIHSLLRWSRLPHVAGEIKAQMRRPVGTPKAKFNTRSLIALRMLQDPAHRHTASLNVTIRISKGYHEPKQMNISQREVRYTIHLP